MTRPFSSIPDLRKQLHDAEVQAARPEPVTIDPGPHIHEWIDDLDECAVVGCDAVHPADVQVGDVVEVTHQHEHVRIVIEGEVYMLADDSRHRFHLRGYGSPEIGDKTTVRRLRRAEPQPDPEQVKALAAIVRDLNREGINLTPNEVAERLVRRGVVVRDEH